MWWFHLNLLIKRLVWIVTELSLLTCPDTLNYTHWQDMKGHANSLDGLKKSVVWYFDLTKKHLTKRPTLLNVMNIQKFTKIHQTHTPCVCVCECTHFCKFRCIICIFLLFFNLEAASCTGLNEGKYWWSSLMMINDIDAYLVLLKKVIKLMLNLTHISCNKTFRFRFLE